MIYYLEVIKEGLSICLDSNTNYYHRFKKGDTIKIDYNNDGDTYLYFGDPLIRHVNHGSFYDGLTINLDKIDQKRLSIESCIKSKYIIDITENIKLKKEREKKLNKILSDESDT